MILPPPLLPRNLTSTMVIHSVAVAATSTARGGGASAGSMMACEGTSLGPPSPSPPLLTQAANLALESVTAGGEGSLHHSLSSRKGVVEGAAQLQKGAPPYPHPCKYGPAKHWFRIKMNTSESLDNEI